VFGHSPSGGSGAASSGFAVQEDEIFGKDKRGDEMPDWASNRRNGGDRYLRSQFVAGALAVIRYVKHKPAT
jgi:hypothetical protein